MVSKHIRNMHAHADSRLTRGVKFALAFIACLFFTSVNAAEFFARTDRSELSNDEHIVLTLELFNSDTRLRAQGVQPNIDLTLLTDNFDLGTPRDKANYNVFRNRGRATSSLEIELFPKKPGTFVIPSFSIDGATTQKITIKVLPSKFADAPLAFSRAGVSHDKIWQRQQLLIYLDTYYRVELDSAKLNGPIELEPDGLDQHEHYRLPPSDRSETVNGFTYKIKRASWSVFPIHSGPLTIHFPDTWITTTNKQQLRLPQETLSVTVKALPANLAPNVFIDKPTLSFTPMQTSNKVGEINSWHAQISAPVSFNDLPASLPIKAPEGLSVFTDNKTDDRIDSSDGIEQIAHYTLSAVATKKGLFQLPSIEFRYFETETGLVKTIAFDKTTLTINEDSMNPPATDTNIITNIQANNSQSLSQSNPTLYWMLATLAFAALWLVTLLYFLRKNRLSTTPTLNEPRATPAKVTDARPLETQLLNALGSRSLEQGLQQWQAQHGAQPQLCETVQQVQRLYYANNTNICTETLQTQVNACCNNILATTSATINPIDIWSPSSFTQSLKPRNLD